MFENARKYVLECILPSYREYFEYQDNGGEYGQHQLLRKGIQCATNIYHLREHLNPQITRKEWEKLCPDYKLLGDIANVGKHKNINNNLPLISNANQIEECTFFIEYEDEDGIYFSPKLEVIVKLDDGTEKWLSIILFNVMTMLIRELRRLRIIEFSNPYELKWNIPIYRNQIKKNNAPIGIIRGEEYKFCYKMFKFNYSKEILEPIDMTGSTLTFSVYEIPNEIPIEIKNSKKNKAIKYTIKLNDEQKNEYHLLNGIDKDMFIEKIISESSNIKKEIKELLESDY